MVDNNGNRLSAPSDPQSTATVDANEAITLMNAAGFAQGSTIYFDIEDGTPPSGAYEQYLLAWTASVAAAGFVPAVYCSHLCNQWAASQNLPRWYFQLISTDPGPYDPNNLPQPQISTGCIGIQYYQNVHLTGLPVQLDLSLFSVSDPSDGNAISQVSV